MSWLTRALLLTFFCATLAFASPADDDVTLVPICTNMPAPAVINAINKADAVRICNAMNTLRGVRVKDIRTFSKSAVALSVAGYRGSFDGTARQLAQIVRLRGLYDNPDRWYANVDIIVRAFQAFNGLLTPQDAIDFLRSAGEASKSLSDDGFTRMLIIVKERKEDAQ